jgi:hypothetical protein
MQAPVRDSYTAADRRRTLAGLSPESRRLAVALLATYKGWDAAAFETLRAYVAVV